MRSTLRSRARLHPEKLGMSCVLVLALAACGGGDAEGTSSAADNVVDDGVAEAAATTTTVVRVETPTDVVEVGTSEIQDWLPTWVDLPEDMQVTSSVSAPETGDGSVTGVIADADADVLFEQARDMADAGGYIPVADIETNGVGFVAERRSDGSQMTFTVVAEGGLVIWSMQFSGLPTDSADDEATAAASADLDRKGDLSLTVPGISSRVDGACAADSQRAAFVSEDGLTTFEVVRDEGATGEVTFEIEGSTMTWSPVADPQQQAIQLTDTSVYFEGEFTIDGENVFGVVQINCG